VTDTRTWRSGGVAGYDDADEHHQFLGRDEENGDGEMRSRSSSLGGEREGLGRLGVMGNPGARLSRLDVGASNGDLNEEDDGLPNNIASGAGGLSAKAGIILGIHNIFIVIPQLIIAGLASIVFAIFEPGKSVLHGHHPGNVIPAMNGTSVSLTEDPSQNVTAAALLWRQVEGGVVAKEGVNSVAVIFRIGGVSAAIACVLCWRLAKELRHR